MIMIDKKLAQELLSVFDTPKNVEIFQKYIDAEILRAYASLKAVTEPAGIYRLQGQIAAYELMRKVRDTALVVVKGE